MARLIDKDALVAEIEKCYNECLKRTKIIDSDYWNAKADAYRNALVILENTLEAKEVQEEPASEDLEEASKEWLKPQLDKSYANYGEVKMMELTHFDGYAMLDAIEFGAKWKEEQFKKNLLDVCKKQTEEEAEIERDFIEGIIENEHRVPTFDDAIKYGMRLQKEQMMAKAIDAVVSQVPCSNEIILYNPSSVYKYSLPQEMDKLGLNKGDKVKVIIIKSE